MPRQASSMSSLYPIVQDLTQEDYAGDCCCPSNLWTAKSEKLFRARNDKALMDTCDSLTQSTVGASGSFDDNYVLTRQIFRNTTSQVWECVHRTSGQRYCVKMIDPKHPNAWQEMSLFKAAQSHANIVELVDILDDHVVMEFMTGGNLLSRVVQAGGLDEATVQKIARTLLSGVKHLHDKGICHNDIQPGNVLLDGTDTAKLADFGNAVRLVKVSIYALQQSSARANVSYTAPEVLSGRHATTASDMWSVGVILFFCLFGRPPFNDRSTGRPIVSRIHRAEYYFPAFADMENKDEDVSRKAKQLISSLLHPDASVRLTVEEALQHCWLFQPRRSSTSSVPSFRPSLPSPTPLLCKVPSKHAVSQTSLSSVRSGMRSLGRRLVCRPFRRHNSPSTKKHWKVLQSNSTETSMASLLATQNP